MIFAIRTRRIPFFRSRGSVSILLATLAVVAVGALLPLTPLAEPLRFTRLPWQLYLLIGAMVVAYLALVEVGKWFFYRTRPTGAQVSLRPVPARPSVHHLVRRVHWFRGGPPDGASGVGGSQG